MDSFNKLVELVEAAKVDAAKVIEGNKSAVTRLRAKMQEIKKLTKEVRDAAQAIKKAAVKA